MILSMTGFGRGIAAGPSRKITVDIKSLNSKQLDLMTRVPANFKEMELEARGIISSLLERGKVEMSATVETIGDSTPVAINDKVILAYYKQIAGLVSTSELPEPKDWFSLLMRLPDTLKTESEKLDKADTEAFVNAVRAAADALISFRVAEGRKLYDFFVSKIANISELLEQVDPFEAERVPKIKARLEEQLSKLSSIEYDRGRLEQELIFYIEKLDVTEEKTRLRAHLNYFLETMGDPDGATPEQGQGKKLGFIAQEMGREINTLGSKSNHAEMQKLVVRMKDELEQIKEQVLNVL